MTIGYQIKDQFALYYLTFQIVQWADIFTRKIYRDIVLDSFKHCCENKGLEIYAYVIMSNHVHLVMRSKTGNLSGTIRDMKKFTSKRIIETVNSGNESRRDWMLLVFAYAANGHNRNENFQVWSHENHAVELFTNKFIEQKINYIHQNPVKAGWVSKPEEYLYSSAAFYAGLGGLFELVVIPYGWKTI